MRKIKRIYLGLPESFKDEVLWVAREYRTNSLSHEPGGSDVVVEYYEDGVLGYDWIKTPSRYISAIWTKGISEVYTDYKEYNEDAQLEIIKEKIKRIFARKHDDENYEKEPFKEVWNSETSDKLPWELLEEFDFPDMFSNDRAIIRLLLNAKKAD
ncbi:hypothetical protein [Pontibacter sp. H249]|uniref:hypothetical protein n=1 Tax=Pontibacter sp. H249 TaxID=3133420 RepID=UPI0030BFAF29